MKEELESKTETGSQKDIIWSNCLSVIKDNISIQSYKTWFEPIIPYKLEGKVLTIQVPSMFFYEWLEEHYVGLIKKTLKKELGTGAKLEYNVLIDKTSNNGNTKGVNMPTQQNSFEDDLEVNLPQPITGGIKNPFIIPGLKKLNIDSQLNPKFSFDNYIEGECNRLSRSAGIAVAAKPGGTAFNPLFIYGGVGLGKTHLVQAIGNEIRQKHKNKTVLYVPSDKFTNQFIDAVRQNSINEFVAFYQLIDVLIVEDVEFFANKDRTQDIFFHIFNHLHQNGKQLILTSDKAPKDLNGFEERLLSRFKWGLSADLKLPDFETRVAIIESRLHADGIELTREVIEYVAHNISVNTRELEGVLISLVAHSSLNKVPLDLNFTKEVLKTYIKTSSKELTVEQIQKVVCEVMDVNIDLLKEKTRKREAVQARQISMHFIKQYTKTSLASIGKIFGGRDHSTVIHAVQTVKDLMETDPKFRAKVQEIEKIININFG